MMVLVASCWCWWAAAPPDQIAVVALDDSAVTAAGVEAVAAHFRRTGLAVESRAGLATRLTGAADPRHPDEEAVARMLADAREREARFDTSGANAIRQEILRLFGSTIRPSPAMRDLAGEAGLDMAAALRLEGHRKAAGRKAREVWRRFAGTRIDDVRHSPDTVSFFERQQQAVAAGPRFRLTVVSAVAGVVFADGTRLGETDARLTAELPPGEYRVWLECEDGASLPHPVTIGETPVEVTIDAEIEQRISVGRVVVLRCDGDCPALLAAVGARTGAARVVGVSAATLGSSNAGPGQQRFRLVDVDARSGKARESFVDANGRPAGPVAPTQLARFNPAYLLPFGGGQLVQDRPLFAAGYLAAQLGLLGWYASVWHSASRAGDLDSLSKERDLRERQALVLRLFVGAVAAGVLEAVVVGLVTGG
jgi:hypothetical protein